MEALDNRSVSEIKEIINNLDTFYCNMDVQTILKMCSEYLNKLPDFERKRAIEELTFGRI